MNDSTPPPAVAPKADGDQAGAKRSIRDTVGPLDVMLSIGVLFAFAVAQPLLDLLGRNAEFFLARAAPPIDLVALVVVLLLVIPTLLAGIVIGIGRLSPSAGRILHILVLTVLAAVLVVYLFDRGAGRDLPGWLVAGIAVGIGYAVATGIRRWTSLRSLIRFASPAPLIFAVVFLFASPASSLVVRSTALADPAQVTVGNPAPVVVVVFDEFPVASLMDETGAIPADIFPNFARLSDDGTWFRNAVTVQQQTEESVPAILTGTNRPGDRLALAADYPATLFTLLSDTYDLRVFESVTELCPDYACENATRPRIPLARRWRNLAQDIGVVGAHLFLPTDLSGGLPAIDQSWGDFGAAGEVAAGGGGDRGFDIVTRFNELAGEDRRAPFAAFLESIEPGTDPQMWFAHVLLPHIPWQYLPSGQGYGAGVPPGIDGPGWVDDAWPVAQANQRHLVQVMFVDTLVGEMIDRLESAGLYDDAVVVIVADHGVTIRPGVAHRRVLYPDTVGTIAAVPLFIKVPGQTETGPDDYRALTTDVVPTIASALDVEIPWPTDGVPLFASERPDRTSTTTTGAEGDVSYGVDGHEKLAAAADKVRWFEDADPFRLAPLGQADLLDQPLDTLNSVPARGVDVELTRPERWAEVDLHAASVPALIQGSLTSDVVWDDHQIVAVAVNGRIAAVTRTSDISARTAEFSALVSPGALREGPNDIEILLVEGNVADGRTLRSVGAAAAGAAAAGP